MLRKWELFLGGVGVADFSLFFIFLFGNRCEYYNLLGMHLNSQLGLICLHFLGGRGGERGGFLLSKKHPLQGVCFGGG